MNFFNRRTKTAAGLAGLLLVAFPLTACGGGDDAPDQVQAVASINALEGGMTQIVLDKDFIPTLGSLGLAPDVIPGATLDADTGTLAFPITGGNVSVFEKGSVPNYVIGQIQHEDSGLKLMPKDGGDGPVVELRNFNVDPGISVVYGDVVVDGKVAATSAVLFRLDGSTLMDLRTEGSTAILEGTKVYISDVAAGLLNDTYGTDKVTGDLLVGTAKITVNTK